MQVTVDLIAGQVSAGPSWNLLTFTAFHYSMADGRSSAWSVYRNSNWTAGAGGLSPLAFDGGDVLTVGSVSWSPTTNEVNPDTYNYQQCGSSSSSSSSSSFIRIKMQDTEDAF